MMQAKEFMDEAAVRSAAEKYCFDKMTLRYYAFKFKEGKSYTKFFSVYHSQVFNEAKEKTFADCLIK